MKINYILKTKTHSPASDFFTDVNLFRNSAFGMSLSLLKPSLNVSLPDSYNLLCESTTALLAVNACSRRALSIVDPYDLPLCACISF